MSASSKWREFQGRQYMNCDDYTDEDMEVISNWDVATKEQKRAVCENHGWGTGGGIYVCDIPDRPPLPVKCHVRIRLADINRTVEWREVAAHDLDEAIKVAEQMPDVEVCLEASFIPGGVLT